MAALWLAGSGISDAVPQFPACRIPGIRFEVRCGKIARPLDPSRPAGASIDVQFVVVPAVSRNPRPDPVFLLAGGPGQSAIDVAGDVLPLLHRLHLRRDIVFVDQRGTGRSAPLECPGAATHTPDFATDPQAEEREMLHCRAALERLPYIGEPANLGFFTTTIAMQDLDAVRAALGAAQLNLIGASYGSRAALEYQRQFSAHLRRSVLDGAAPPDMVLPESASADNQAALEALWAACAAESACRSAFPHLATDWTALKASLPRSVLVQDPMTGESKPLTVTTPMLLGAVRGPLYSPALAAALPQAITNAAAGHFEGLFSLSAMLTPRRSMQFAAGMHFSVICAEDAPRMAASAQSPGADFGRLFSDSYQKICEQWPRATVPAAFYTMPPAMQPVLILSGALDPMTPPRHAARVVAALGSKARSVSVANAGHGILGVNCISDVVFRFIDAPDESAALGVDAGCAQAIPRPLAFITARATTP